jgi:hypothetical protein
MRRAGGFRGGATPGGQHDPKWSQIRFVIHTRMLPIARRSSRLVVTSWPAQVLLPSAQAMDVAMLAKVSFAATTAFATCCIAYSLVGFASLDPRYAGDRPPSFTLAQRRESSTSPCRGRTTTTCRS